MGITIKMKDYSKDVQKFFIEMMLNEPQSFLRVQNIYNVKNFDDSLQDVAKMISEHSDEHGYYHHLNKLMR